MSGSPSDPGTDDRSKTLAKSIGEVASPLLAGFSFTNVIVIITSSGISHFLLPGEAIIFWTIASISFIVAIQYAKYVADGEAKLRRQLDFYYHVGVFTFLIGFGMALAPPNGAEVYVFRWFASGLAFTAFVVESCKYGIHEWKHRSVKLKEAKRLLDRCRRRRTARSNAAQRAPLLSPLYGSTRQRIYLDHLIRS